MEYGTYFLCAALSVAAGFAAAVLRAKKSGLPTPKAALVFLAAAVIGALGARLYCVAARTLPGGILFEKAFLSDRPYDYAACGAVIGAPLAAFFLSRALKMPAGRTADIWRRCCSEDHTSSKQTEKSRLIAPGTENK